ncbi:MAG: SDR family oxidoreductase [Phycisphaerales bacterium]|nr:SDR family oxidoreductase [Phycisphaerales bacterium]
MNQIDLNGKNAIVTGGARGIGFAITQRLLASGASACVWDRDQAALDKAAGTLGDKKRVHTVRVDIANPDSVKAAAAQTISHFGKVDILVNNAGIAGVTKKLTDCPPAEWREVLEVNLFGVFLCCHALAPHMVANGYGRIVNIASIAGKEGNPNASAYSAAKAGVIALTKSLAKETAREGLIVNCITPAVIQTEILEQVPQSHIDYMLSKIPMGRFGLKEEAAAMVAWLCSADCSFTTGAAFDLSGGRATY